MTNHSSPESPSPPQGIEPDILKPSKTLLDSAREFNPPAEENKGAVMYHTDENGNDTRVPVINPAEEIGLSMLKEHIMSNGFNEAVVSMYLNLICASPNMVPSTTTWNMPKRERLPAMVYKTLIAPGFLDTIYPALKIVMGSNIGNTDWTASTSITFAFFGVIWTLPYILEMEKNGG